MTALNSGDLSEIERAVLAVLGAGLAPSSLAQDPSFRVDYLTAVTLALARGLPRETYLEPGAPRASLDFQRELTAALHDLDAKRVLGMVGPPADVLLAFDAPPPPSPPPSAIANFDQHPAIFDRYLAGRCLDELLRNPDVYRFIMDRYADSSEIFQRLYRQQP